VKLGHDKSSAAAWMVTAVCGLILAGLLVVPLATESRLDGTQVGGLLVPLFFALPMAFFQVAREIQRLRTENESLRRRLDAFRGESEALG